MARYGLTVIGDTPWVETIKRALEAEEAVEIRFSHPVDWNATRKLLYNNFRGYDVQIKREDDDSRRVLILNEKIRTSDPVLHPSTTESKAVVKLADFFIISRRCKCCGEMLPEEKFGKRHYGDSVYRQSYCLECQRTYSVWRGKFLKEHKADKLTPLYTVGRKQRNELFHTWYAEHREVI